MITFKQFINEGIVKSWDLEPSERDTAIKWIKANASESLEQGFLIYRGMWSVGTNISFINSATGERTSNGSNNIYQLMMDSSNNMADIPSRTKSFICSTKSTMAQDYGKLYVMFPAKGTNIAVAASEDYLVSTMIKSPLDEIVPPSSSIAQLSRSIGTRLAIDGSPSLLTKEKLESYLSTFTPNSVWDSLSVSKEIQKSKLQKLHAAGRTPFEAFCDTFVNPSSMSISSFKYGSGKPPKKNLELWFSGKSLVVSFWSFAEMLPELADSIPISKSIMTKFKVPPVNK